MSHSKTYQAKPTEVTRTWYVVDAADIPLGRLATAVAALLIGKGKPMFTKHIDTGDYVVVTNAKNLVVTGKKLTQKTYYKHSGYPGGLTEKSLATKIEEDPASVIVKAVRGMLPVNKLRPARLERLKVYSGEHTHEAQKPKVLSLKPTGKANEGKQ